MGKSLVEMILDNSQAGNIVSVKQHQKGSISLSVNSKLSIFIAGQMAFIPKKKREEKH